MTYEEALEYAKGGLEVYLKDYPELTTQIEFQKLAIKALEKQIPKKPKCRLYHSDARCPVCNMLTVFELKYCPDCGQKLDWVKYV